MPKIEAALQDAIEIEKVMMEKSVEKEILFNKQKAENIVSMFEWLREKSKSRVLQVATAAAALLFVIFGKESFDGYDVPKEVATLSQNYTDAQLAEMNKQKIALTRLEEWSGGNYHLPDYIAEARYSIIKYTLLANLNNKTEIERALPDDETIMVVSSLIKFSESELEHLKFAYNNTKSKKLDSLIGHIEKNQENERRYNEEIVEFIQTSMSPTHEI